jgi:hypothetical protein
MDNGSAGHPRMSASRKKRQLSRHARGYTNAHVARRRQLEPLVATGTVNCSRCGQLIEPGQAWHRSGYLGPSHATCNLRAAANKTNGTRRDQQLIWSRVWYEPIPPNVVLSSD